MTTFEEILKMLGGGLGKATDIGLIGSPLIPDQNISESLESYGGSPGSFVLVPKASASEPVTEQRYDLTSQPLNYTPGEDFLNTDSTDGGDILGTTTDTTTDTGVVDPMSYLEEQIALARAAAEEGIRRAGVAFGQARGIYDEGMGLVGQRRGEFKDIFETGKSDILNTYEGERGNLQRSAQGAKTRSANMLRALGLGGSAAIKSEGRQRQQGARLMGDLSTGRNTNERENLRGYNVNQDFANLQEGSLGRFLTGAQEARTASENQSELIERGDVAGVNQQMGSFLNQILQSQLAMNTANTGTGSYTANPYAVNLPNLTNSLNAVVPTMGGTTGGENQAVSIESDNSLAALLEKQRLAALYGGGLTA